MMVFSSISLPSSAAGLVRLYLLSYERLCGVGGRHSFILLLSTVTLDASIRISSSISIISIAFFAVEQIVDSARKSIQVFIDTI